MSYPDFIEFIIDVASPSNMGHFSTWGTIAVSVGSLGMMTVVCGFIIFMNKLNKL